jgi:hypothetical protein
MLTLSQIEANQKMLNKAVRKSRKASKAMAKAQRKMEKALHSRNIQEIQVLLGMAKVAIQKAETIAKMSL